MLLTLQIALGVFAGMIILPIVFTVFFAVVGGIFSILFGD